MAGKPIITYDYTDRLNDDDVFLAAGEQVNTINALNASGDINNKAFGGYDPETSDSRIKSAIDDVLSYAVDARVAAYSSGNIAHITNGIKNGLFKSIKASFNPIQKNKYDTTWIGGGGINKMPSLVRATKTGGGTSSITCQVTVNSGLVRLTGEQGSTATTTFRLDFNDKEKRVKLPGNNSRQRPLYLHLNNSAADSKITVHLVYTPSSSTSTQRFDVALDAQNKVSRINTYGISGARLNYVEIIIRSQSVDFRLAPMITLSEENEAWRPFSNVRAIDGYSGVTFTRCGKNLLKDPQKVTVEAQKPERTVYPICVLPLLPNGTYCLSYTQDKDVTTDYYNRIHYVENGYSHSCPESLTSGRHSVTITVRDASQVKIEWEARNVSDECHITDFQLEYADTSSEYTEYEGDTYSVEFKIAGTSKKEYRGSFDLITGELVVTGALVKLGDYNWRYNETSKKFSCDHFADVIKTGRNKYATDILCSSYTPCSGSSISPDMKVIQANLKSGYIYIFDSDYAFFDTTPTAQEIINRQNEFKVSLASTTMFIPFAEPSRHWYSPTTVRSFLSINNIWSDIGDVDVTYPLDLKAYIDHAIGRYSIQTVSGPIAHYTNNFKTVPTKSVKAQIDPVQEGSGAPSPDNVRPITGWTGAKVTRCGKNLLEPKFYDGLNYNVAVGSKLVTTLTDVTNTVTKTGNVYTKSGSSWSQPMNMMLPLGKAFVGQTVQFSGGIEASGFRSAYYVTDADYIVKRRANSNNERPIWNITVEDGDAYLFWYINSSNRGTITLTEPQIELGSTATAYEPYHADTYDITFPTEAGTVYGGTLDVTKGEMVVDRAIRTVSPTAGQTVAIDGVFLYRFRLDDIKTEETARKFECSHFYKPSGFIGGTPSANGMVANQYYNVYNICMRNDALQTAEDWKEYINSQVSGGTPIQFCYELATPITYTLTPQEITSLLGTNNLWADTGDIEVKYLTHTEA